MNETRTIRSNEMHDFYEAWRIAYSKYSEILPGHHLSFPEALLKKIAKKIDSSLTESKKPYDFEGNIEMKSVTYNKGNSHFSTSQTDCKRILYFVISSDEFEYYDITNASILKKINSIVSKAKENKEKGANIVLSNFTKDIEPIKIKFSQE